jgi:predicted transcriptional regulator
MYKGIFKDIKKGSDISVYEEHFTDKTNQNYREFLHNIFINEDKTKQEIANLLGVTAGVITSHTRKYEIKKEHTPDTSNVMYKTPSIIEKETGRKFIDVYNELASQGLSLTEICIKLNIRLVSTVSTYLTKYRQRQERLNMTNEEIESKLIVKDLSNKNLDTVEVLFYNQIGIEYEDYLRQKYLEEGYSLNELSLMLGVSRDTLSRTVRHYGMHKTKSQARQEAMRKGNVNYDKILSKSRKTMNKSKSSSKQDLLITLLKHHLELAFTELDNTEIILGYNEYCILGSMEVDIPIVIFKGNKVYKVALEYDGDIWHDHRLEQNTDKEMMLHNKGWFFINIEETNEESSSLEIVEDKAKYIVNEIIKYINYKGTV